MPERGLPAYFDTVRVPAPDPVAVIEPTVPWVPIDAVAVPAGLVLVEEVDVVAAFDTGTTWLDGAEAAPGPKAVSGTTVKE